MPIPAANTLTPLPIEWLWPGYLAVGSLAILDGDPGQGKSLITLDLAARLTMGREWPDGVPMAEPASVLFLCDEDVDSVILARLKAAGADLARTFLWPRLDDPGLPRVPTDIARIDEALTQTGAKLLVIDPIVAFLDSTVQVSGDANVRRALRPLAGLAERHRCVILLIRHLNKRTENQSLYRGGGSIAFVAACRLAWLAGRDPKMEERCVLAQAKNNYAPKQTSLAYTLPKDGPRVDWQGPSLWSADELAARRARPSRRRARDFLRAFLEAGPRLSHEVWMAAAAERLSKKTVYRAKDELGIRYERISRRGERLDYWLMPGQEVPAGLSDTPEADELLRKLGEQWAGREPRVADSEYER
jgi:RecA-family ATPase